MNKKKINLKEMLAPQADKLQTNGIIATATILDAELDEIECTFNNDMCVEINTEELKYITLTIENLYTLINLIEEADEYYENYDFEADDENNTKE